MSENGFRIPSIKDGEVRWKIVDPDFPCGDSVSAEEEQQVIDEWIEEKAPNIDQTMLNNMGISIDFIPGETIDNMEDWYDPSEYTIADVVYDGNKGEYKTEDGLTVGTFYKEPGHIEVKVDAELLLSNMGIVDGKLTESAAADLNKAMGVDAFNASTTIAGAINLINEFKKGTKLENVTSSTLFFIGLFEDEILGSLGLESIWDADESELTRVIDAAAKGGEVLTGVMTILIAFGIPVPGSTIIDIIALMCVAIDVMIEDFDNIISLDKDGNIVYDFDLTTDDGGTRNYNKTIELDYSKPKELYDKIAIYAETGKIDIEFGLKKLLEDRVEIIDAVKKDVDFAMKNITSSSDFEGLAKIYNIEVLTLDYYNNMDSSTAGNDTALVFFESSRHLEYRLQDVDYLGLEDGASESSSQDTCRYEQYYTGTHTRNPTIIRILSEETIEEINQIIENHNEAYINSYYEYYANNKNIEKDNFINELVKKDCVGTGEVDIWEGLSFNGHSSNSTSIFSQPLSYELEDEANKNKTNFMSENRIMLAQNLVEMLYNDIMVILSNYTDITESIQQKEEAIISKWSIED